MGKQLHVEHAPVNEGTGVDQDKVVADVTRDSAPVRAAIKATQRMKLPLIAVLAASLARLNPLA